MSILSAIKEAKHDNNNLQDLALLPQTLVMQMAQRGEIEKDLVPLILNKKAEMIEAEARNKALARSGQPPMPTVMEQKMAQIAQAENPVPEPQMMPQQMAQMPAPQLPEEVGIAQNPIPPMQMAGGGIIAFAPGGDVDEDDSDDDESYEDYLDEIQRARLESMIRNVYQDGDMGAGVGIAYMEATPRDITKEAPKKDKGGIEDLTAYVLKKESGGRRYDKEGNLLTSSKGALGEMQVMPMTITDPGFGVTPARNRSPDEIARVGREYLGAMLNRYGDPKLAAIAYNMGPGATDKWLASGADVRRLPAETRGYIAGLAGGGEVKHFQTGGTMSGFGDENYDLDTLRMQEVEAARKQQEYENQYNFLRQSAPDVAARMKPPVVAAPAATAAPQVVAKPSVEIPVQVVSPSAAEVATPMSVEDKLFAQMQDAIAKREARLEAARKQDPWLAGLAAGLGMLGGTSPYAMVNIGQGGGQGVAQYAASQRARAAEEAGIGSLQNKLYSSAMTGAIRKDLQAQANAAKYANALTNVRQERLQLEEKYTRSPEYMDLSTISIYAQRLAKNPNDKEAKAKYDSLIAKKQALEDRIRKQLPDPNPALFGIKNVAGKSSDSEFAGFSAKERKG